MAERHDYTASTKVKFEAPYQYPVYFCHNLFHPRNSLLADLLSEQSGSGAHKCLIFIDRGVAEAHPQLPQNITGYAREHADILELSDDPRVLAGGEQCKNSFDVCQDVIRRARRVRLCRHSCILAIGGGAFLDAVGFAAALIHRGVRLIRVPTTVLAQNDSGIGVKNGVNLNGAKNFLGVFAPPAAVFNDFSFLHTLSRRDWISGMAEAFKVAVIKDRQFLDWLLEHIHELATCEPDKTEYLIRRCAELHAAHIGQGGDPFETGAERPLDFGHWAGHKLESLSLHELRHGEAVAIGMAIDLLYAAESGFISIDDAYRIIGAMKKLGLPVWHSALEVEGADGEPLILAGIEEFRQHLGGSLTVPFPSPLGAKRDVSSLDINRIKKCIRDVCRIENETVSVHDTKTSNSRG